MPFGLPPAGEVTTPPAGVVLAGTSEEMVQGQAAVMVVSLEMVYSLLPMVVT